MYLRRKIDNQIENRFKQDKHSPCLIFGVRQCGKTSSIMEFAKKHFKNVNYVNFWKVEDAKLAFNGSLEVDAIIKKLTIYYPSFKFEAGSTVIILDEIQDCPNARLSLKSFKDDGRFEVIASGSFIGLNIEKNNQTPVPSGCEDILEMKTMDFEEFLWARNFGPEKIDEFLYKPFLERKRIEPFVYKIVQELFKEYLCVGGYPETVSLFISTNSFNVAFKKNLSLIFDIKNDPAKRKTDDGKPYFTASDVFKIQVAFDAIASFMEEENKRYVASRVIKGNGDKRQEVLNYLINAGVAFKVFNVTVPSTPLESCVVRSDFKLFYSDIGILVARNGFETIRGILDDTLGMNKGYLYEAAIGCELYKANIPTYYFSKKSGLEVDFLISYECVATLIEAKARNGNAKSSKTIMNHPEHYGETRLIKFGNYNIEEEGKILTLPHYLVFLLGRYYNEEIKSRINTTIDLQI